MRSWRKSEVRSEEHGIEKGDSRTASRNGMVLGCGSVEILRRTLRASGDDIRFS